MFDIHVPVALIFVVVFTEFTSTEREQLAFCLGNYEKDSIVKDCVEVSSLFKDIETLQKTMWMLTFRIKTK